MPYAFVLVLEFRDRCMKDWGNYKWRIKFATECYNDGEIYLDSQTNDDCLHKSIPGCNFIKQRFLIPGGRYTRIGKIIFTSDINNSNLRFLFKAVEISTARSSSTLDNSFRKI